MKLNPSEDLPARVTEFRDLAFDAQQRNQGREETEVGKCQMAGVGLMVE